ncbi:MAG: major capsid family protein [Thiobacillus sp.]
MANFFPAQARVSPSFAEPELILTYTQPSGAFSALEGGKPRVKIGSEDLYVYINSIDLRTEAQTASAAGNFLPSASLVGSYNQTATYLIRTRSIWDHHDIAAAAQYAVSLPEAQNLASRQGIFQQMRTMLLYGFQPANGEGLLNAANATSTTLPADSNGNTTLRTYDNGQMALFLLSEIIALKAAMFQTGFKNKVRIISPQRIQLAMQMQMIVQITSYQRDGAGSATTAGTVQEILARSGDEIEWAADDTLIGKGSGGTDMVIITIPEIVTPEIGGINTGIFNGMQPNMKAVNLMYTDMAAPMRIPTPIPEGITEVQELRCSSGWNIRGQGLTLVSMPY